MRAALGEYVSMEDAIKYDISKVSYPKIARSRNPLLRLMKELRNLQFHVINSALASTPKDVIYAKREFEMNCWHIEDLTIEEFNQLKNASHYADRDKERMINWFNENQKKWGINELIVLAVCAYAEEIVNSTT